MQVEIANVGSLGKRLTISYSPDEVAQRREQVLRGLAGEVKLQGFRPGKSAKNVVEKRFGETATAKAEEDLANEGFKKAVTEKKLQPIGQVKAAESDRKAGLRLVFDFEVKPAVKLPDPTTLKVTQAAVTVDDAEVDDTIQSLRRRGGKLDDLAASETLVADDSITLTGSVSVGGAEVRKLQDLHHLLGAYPLLGKDPKEVLALAKDKTVGSVLSFATVLPQSFKPEEHAGKEATVSLTVQKAQRIQPAELTDEFAKSVGVADVAALRQAVRDSVTHGHEQKQHQKQIEELMSGLLKGLDVELPPQLFAALRKERLDAALAKAESEGVGGDALATLRKTAESDAETGASEALKRFLVLDAIAETYQVQVSREDLDQQLQMAAARSGRKPDELAKKLTESGRINDVVQEIREAKSLEVLLAKVLGRELPAAHGEAGHVHGPDCDHDHGHEHHGHAHG